MTPAPTATAKAPIDIKQDCLAGLEAQKKFIRAQFALFRKQMQQITPPRTASVGHDYSRLEHEDWR